MIPIALLPLLLSEILANEPGSSTALEFIELQAQQPVSDGFFSVTVNGASLALPVVAMDSGQFLVLCRDSLRFEAHFGDSSGVWGDAGLEEYLLQEVTMSLVNGGGTVAISDDHAEDRFSWDGSAGDGISYERVSDSVWQTTDPQVKSTPGRRNHGAPVQWDWAVTDIEADPPLPAPGESALLLITVANAGLATTSAVVTVVDMVTGDSLATDLVSGTRGEVVELGVAFAARHGLNRFRVEVSADDRPGNNTAFLVFYAGDPPVVISELYPAPEGPEPEWLELFVPAPPLADSVELVLSDPTGTTTIPQPVMGYPFTEFSIVTSDSAAFRLVYPHVLAPVLQPEPWVSLNNDGDTLELSLNGAITDRVIYPSAGSRRGAALERIGLSQVWGWSVALRGATPGEPNSIDVPYIDGIDVKISPNPFGAGMGETALIQYQVPFEAVGEIRLYRGDGRHVRTLVERSRVVSGEVEWDGRSATGERLPVGIYLVQFRLYEPRELVHLSTVVVAR